MSGYLDEYGEKDARREAIVKRIVLVVVLVVAIGGILYFQFRNYREKATLSTFVELLGEEQYREAYALWGCTDQQPCPEYPFSKFMEDWGPDSPHSRIEEATITRTRSCSDGIIQVLSFGEDEEVLLFVDREERVISFSPWPMCNPHFAPEQ